MNEQTSIPKMLTNTDCGVVAEMVATGKTYAECALGLKYPAHNDMRDDLSDTPFNHFAALAGWGIPFQLVSDDDILKGIAENHKTIILWHSPDSPFLCQHWVVLHSITETSVRVYYGDGTIREVSRENFKKYYQIGWPNCAFIVGKGRTYLPWYQRLWVWLTGTFL